MTLAEVSELKLNDELIHTRTGEKLFFRASEALYMSESKYVRCVDVTGSVVWVKYDALERMT
jgi:hypothetical protein